MSINPQPPAGGVSSEALQDTARPVAVLSTDQPAGLAFPAHAHRRGQLMYAISGVVIVRAAHGSWVVPTGRAVWLPPMAEHDVLIATDVKIRTVFVEPDIRPGFPQTCQVIAVGPLLHQLIISAASLELDYPLGGREQRIVELILDEIEMAPALSLHVPMPRHTGLLALCSRLLEQPSSLSTLDGWATALGMNSRTFARLFHRELGITFGAWLRQARLLLSLPALAQGESVLNVALEHGYDSPSAFSAAFRRTFGLSPSAYLSQGNTASPA